MSINTFTIIGNVTKALELRRTPTGTAVVTYTVAVNNIYTDGSGQRREEVDFIPVTTFGKQAENDAKYLGKGAPVAIQGRIRSWYKPEERKGGFNFEAVHVQYLGQSRGQQAGEQNDTPASPADDDWAREYDSATMAGQRR